MSDQGCPPPVIHPPRPLTDAELALDLVIAVRCYLRPAQRADLVARDQGKRHAAEEALAALLVRHLRTCGRTVTAAVPPPIVPPPPPPRR